jgi:hypothetical protein
MTAGIGTGISSNGATNSQTVSRGSAVDTALTFRSPTSVDAYATTALTKTFEWLFRDSKNQAGETIPSPWRRYREEVNRKVEQDTSIPDRSAKDREKIGETEPVKDRLAKKIAVERIHEVTRRLDTTGLDDTTRLLLSNSDIYAFMLLQSVGSVKPDDIAGLANAVLLRVADQPKRSFLARILAEVTRDLKVKISRNDPTNKNWPRLVELTLERGINIRAGQVRSSVMDLLGLLYSEGNIPYYLNKYILERSIVPISAFTPTIKRSMIKYLGDLGVQFDVPSTETRFEGGEYDKSFLLAYSEARKMSSVADDPIDNARVKGGELNWNFTVDSFDSVNYQGIIPANIRAAGALDYIYTIGEEMRVFDVANALILRWAGGMLDIPEGKTAAALYRFHKLRDDRNTPAERAMLYKRVLNKGGGKLLSRMVANTAFPMLWHQLMEEVVKHIRKSERSKDVWVSRSPIFEATRNLQYNLTEHMTGMSHAQVTEDYAHLQEALDILKSEEILNSFGGRRKNLWSVIEQVAKEDLRTMVATATLRTIAVEGNKVFQWIANFESAGSVREADFEMLLSAAESWILAQASMQTGRNGKFLPDDPDPRPRSRPPQRMASAGRSKAKPKRPQTDDFDDWDV